MLLHIVLSQYNIPEIGEKQLSSEQKNGGVNMATKPLGFHKSSPWDSIIHWPTQKLGLPYWENKVTSQGVIIVPETYQKQMHLPKFGAKHSRIWLKWCGLCIKHNFIIYIKYLTMVFILKVSLRLFQWYQLHICTTEIDETRMGQKCNIQHKNA